MKTSLLLLSTALVFQPTVAYQHPRKREICTVRSLNDPLLDDVPAIAAALKSCGDSGRIVLPTNQTFTLRSPLDLSLCQACDFQMNGIIKVSADWDYWSGKDAAIIIRNATAAIIRSEWESAAPGLQGVIDAQFFGLNPKSTTFPILRIPKLFSIEQESYQIHTRGLKVRNTPGTAFHVGSNSTAVRFYSVEIETPADTAFEVDGAHHTYLWNNTIRASNTCVKISPNSSNVQVEESTCITSNTLPGSIPSGLEINFGVGPGLNWIRNIFVKKLLFTGSMYAINFVGGGGEKVEIRNATFTDVTVEGPARRAALIDQGETKVDITGVTLKDIKGVEEERTALVCQIEGDVCEFTTEGWGVVQDGGRVLSRDCLLH